jgi:hypothetical protein
LVPIPASAVGAEQRNLLITRGSDAVIVKKIGEDAHHHVSVRRTQPLAHLRVSKAALPRWLAFLILRDVKREVRRGVRRTGGISAAATDGGWRTMTPSLDREVHPLLHRSGGRGGRLRRQVSAWSADHLTQNLLLTFSLSQNGRDGGHDDDGRGHDLLALGEDALLGVWSSGFRRWLG